MAKDKQPRQPKDPSAPKKPRSARLTLKDRLAKKEKSRAFHAAKVADLDAGIKGLKDEQRTLALAMLEEVGGLEQVELPLAQAE